MAIFFEICVNFIVDGSRIYQQQRCPLPTNNQTLHRYCAAPSQPTLPQGTYTPV